MEKRKFLRGPILCLILGVLFLVVFSPGVYAAAIELAGQGFIPDPNQEITVQIQTDVSLFAMGVGIEVVGDATITTAMCEADCNDFGWNNGWNSDPHIDPNGWLYISGVSWPGEATGIVGYFKFQYHSGQVTVSIFCGDAFDVNWQPVPFSDKILVFGEPDLNAMQAGGNAPVVVSESTSEITPYESEPNSMSLNEENIPATAVIENADPNAGSQSSASDSQTTANGSGIESIQQSEPFEELSNPLGSCILQSKTYRIATLPLLIEGHVVIPAGTRLIAPFDPNSTVIEVMPGGLLDTGRAAFYSGENYPAVLPPVEILPEYPNQYFRHNNIGIYVRRGAHPSTRICNTIVNNCRIGIIVDEALTGPVQHVITFGCYDGIYLFAPNTITDSEFWYYGTIYEGIYGYVGAGIYINLDGGDYSYPTARIDRTATYGGDVGIFMEGGISDPNLADPNQTFPGLEIVNSVMAASYFYGLYKTDGDADVQLKYCAFGGNRWNSNLEMPFTGCVGLSYDPFYIISVDDKRLYTDQQSEAIDAGYGMADDGMGTCHNQPDIGMQDIGCHFALGISGGFGIPSSPADFNGDGIVDELDLELMNFCMGAVSDPNIVKIDTNYDSRVNLPDFGNFSFDYGYASDPNVSGNNDPNCQRSDFNTDHRVDLEDLEILAEHWLTVVMDEYRICSLCNLYKDPNAMKAINADDMDAFMADWMKRFTSDPNIAITQSASRLSVAVQNPDLAWKITAFLDDELIGQWENWDLGAAVFGVDMMRFGPGSHRLKIVRNIGYGLEITGQILTDPNSIDLYYAEIPEYFGANQSYEISGFNPLNKQYAITFTNDLTGQIVDTITVSDGFVDVSIPGSVLGNNFASVSIKDSVSDKEIIRDLKKPFDPNDWDPINPRAVIICPDTYWWNSYDLFVQRRPAILAAARAFENQGIAYCVLYKKDVTPANLRFVLGNRSLRYVYWVGHGNYYVGNPKIYRTSVNCWVNGKKVPAFSFTRQTISNASALLTAAGNDYDRIGFDLNSITIDGQPMREAGTKRLVVIDVCSSCVTRNLSTGEYDMAWVFGAYNYRPSFPLSEHMNYIGWAIDVDASGGTIFNDNTTDRMVDFWEVLGTGNNLALAYERIWNNSASVSASASLLPTFFGDDQLNQYGKEDDTFKREGLGPKEQKLENR